MDSTLLNKCFNNFYEKNKNNVLAILLVVIDRLKEEFVVDSIKFDTLDCKFYDVIINGYVFSISSHRISYGVDACYLFLLNEIYSSKYAIERRPKELNEYDAKYDAKEDDECIR